MNIVFLTGVHSPDYNYAEGDVIDTDTRPPDQVERWLNRGVVKAAEPAPTNPKRTATVTPKKKAVIE